MLFGVLLQLTVIGNVNEFVYKYFFFFSLDSGESILETMTDIGHEYFLQITKHLRSAADSAALNANSGFPVCRYS